LSAEKDLSWLRKVLYSLRTLLTRRFSIDTEVMAVLYIEAYFVGGFVFDFDSGIGLLERLVGLALYCIGFFLMLKFYSLLDSELPEPEGEFS